ncbi:cyclic AMP-dependent transcription factor ATF-4-like [Brachionus plicatilis]|uniref:Cyclic AMP-dependent transcription factor ATF-4-like n=1 Tax=Brachionus plicatilis TaxID=10195 RepID=A0A3M7PN02_BRAPC|nr:cyclic AMP-dependent transcription factor ATF-4-like [Brachionus plicatilis]
MKKESNKEAATRYRIKKSNERDSLFQTKVNLEKDNDKIRQRIELIQIEISYLKNMLVQTLLNKGVLNEGTQIS